MVDYLVARKARYAANSWGIVRASVTWALERVSSSESALRSRQIEAAIERLRRESPEPDADRPVMTSRMKAKKIPEGDMARIRRLAADAGTATGVNLGRYLNAGTLTGLRPCEWPTAIFRRSLRAGFKFELMVANAKATNGRGNGSHRMLYWPDLPERLVDDVLAWIETARQPGYDTRLDSMGKLMAKATRSLFPNRKKWPTLYSTRHEAVARWKAYYCWNGQSQEERLLALATIAALMGHGSDETASKHYARARKGSGHLDLFQVPAADPDQIATVRRVIELDWRKSMLKHAPGMANRAGP